MGRFTLFSSLNRILRFSSKSQFLKHHPLIAIGCGKYCGRTWRDVHTQNVTSENILMKDATEREHFIDESVPHDVVMDHLLKCSSLEEQMRTLYSVLRLTPKDIEQRHVIVQQVVDMLSPFFKDFKIDIFGSSANSYGFKGCDIDMVFNSQVDEKDVQSTSFDDSDIPTHEAVLRGEFSRRYMDHLSPRDQLLFIHTVFLDYYKDSDVAPIFINAHIPIVRFQHDRYQLKIDLTCSNRLGIYNSKLLYVYGQFDSRVIPLISVVRYWAKHLGLIGGGLLFNTYCLTLFVIYFLQTRQPPVIPTVEYIQSVTDQITTTVISEENYSKILGKLPPSKNTETLGDLLHEFFFYYLYFDFGQVMCPRSGTSLPRSEFTLGEESKKFKFNTICVQDPLKLTHNVANLVHFKHCKLFAKEMLSVCQLFQDKRMMSPCSEPWGLAALFDVPPRYTEHWKTEGFQVDIPTREGSDVSLLLKTAKDILRIFEKALLFDCQNVQETYEVVSPAQDGDTQLLLSCHCYGHANTWMGRNCVKTDDLIRDDVLEFERAVSLRLGEKDKEVDKKCDFDFMAKFYVMKQNGELSLMLKLNSPKTPSFHCVVGVFLREYLLQVLKKMP